MLHYISFVPTFIFPGPLSFHRLRPLSIPGFYSEKLRIRRGAPDWVKRGLNSKNQKQNVAKLEESLMNNWRELDTVQWTGCWSAPRYPYVPTAIKRTSKWGRLM